MRLREIRVIIQDNIKQLKVEFDRTENGDKTIGYRIKNFQIVYEAVMNLKELNYVDKEVSSFEERFSMHRYRNDYAVLDQINLKILNANISSIIEKSQAVVDVISMAVPEQSENGVSIKIPNTNSLNEMQKIVKTIDNIISQSLVGEYKCEVKFAGFDSGSEWIEVILENKLAILFLGKLVKNTFDFVQSSYLTYMQTKYEIEKLEIDNEAQKTVLDALRSDVEAKKRANAQAIMNEFNITENENEYCSKLTNSIGSLSKLIMDGAEFHPALNSPLPSSKEFPSKSEILELTTKTEQLLIELKKQDSNKSEGENSAINVTDETGTGE